MSKDIRFGDEARAKMLSGMQKVSDTVTVTMGPKGRNVMLDRGYGSPLVTNDGVTIAKEIELEDKFENMGAELIKQSADKTNSIAGDGTTTATLLTYNLTKEGMRYIKTGVNPVRLKNGMRKAGEKVTEELFKNSKQISSKEEVAQVASISAQDSEVGRIIAEAMEKVGNAGVITVEEGKTFGIDVEVTEGMEFEQGYISPYMVTDTDKMIAEIKDATVFITDQKITSMKEFLPVLETLVNEGKKELVVICEDMDGDALTALILNKLKGSLNVLAVKAPGFGDRKEENLKDIAILTGGTFITSKLGMKFENVTASDFGYASAIIAKKDKTTIVGGAGEKSEIESRVREIQNQIDVTESKYDKEKLAERLAKLAGGVAVIKVGAASEVEMKEQKLRIEDALNATRAAVEEGVVAGGGVALLKASKVLENIDFGNEDENIGAQIVRNSLSSPVRQISENAGKEGGVIVNTILNNPDVNFGYNAENDTFENMMTVGIIDPTKVERVALENSISISSMFLTTEAAVVELPKKEENHDHSGMGMGGMGGMGMM